MLNYLHCEDSHGIGGCRTKNSPTLWQGFMHLQWNRFHIFTNKRGTYGIIADGLRFDTQLSNVYGNAIRAKLAAAQTTRSVAGSFSSFVTQNLQSICDYAIGIHFHCKCMNPRHSPRPRPKAVFVEGLELSYGIRGNFINLFPYYIYLSS